MTSSSRNSSISISLCCGWTTRHRFPSPISIARRRPWGLTVSQLWWVPIHVFPDGTSSWWMQARPSLMNLSTTTGVITEGTYRWGKYTRIKALSAYCDKLPVINPNGDIPDFGYSTETAIRAGVIHGIELEIMGYIQQMQQKYPNLLVFLTGGDDFSFDTKLKVSSLQINFWY